MDRSIYISATKSLLRVFQNWNQRPNQNIIPHLKARLIFFRLFLRAEQCLLATLKSKLLRWKDRQGGVLSYWHGWFCRFCQRELFMLPPISGLGQLPFHDCRKASDNSRSRRPWHQEGHLRLSAQRDREKSASPVNRQVFSEFLIIGPIAPTVIVIVHSRQIIRE